MFPNQTWHKKVSGFLETMYCLSVKTKCDFFFAKMCAWEMTGPIMVAPNKKSLQANNKNRKALGDIGNLVRAKNAKCNLNKYEGDGVCCLILFIIL